MTTLKLEGQVTTGEGNGKKFLSLQWVQQQIEEKLGFTPFLGTLNLRLTPRSAENKKLIEKTEALKIYPSEKGYCEGILVKASIDHFECAIVIPQTANYPRKILEIIATQNLREVLQLKDGDKVTITVQI